MTTSVDSSKIVMYSTNWCPDCFNAKNYFKRNKIEYVEIDIEKHPDAVAIVLEVNNGRRSVPTIVFPDGSTLTEPSWRQLDAKFSAS